MSTARDWPPIGALT